MQPLPFREVWCCDFEFSAPDGERPAVRCMVAKEYRTGRIIRLWLESEPAPAWPPFTIDRGRPLFVAYFASAEMGCFLTLGWLMPVRVLDLYAECKWDTCGRNAPRTSRVSYGPSTTSGWTASTSTRRRTCAGWQSEADRTPMTSAAICSPIARRT